MDEELKVPEQELIRRFRGAVRDRAVWFALLYRSFREVLSTEETEALCRKAIRKYGLAKAKLDGRILTATGLMEQFVSSGGAKIFDARVEPSAGGAVNYVGCCPLVEAWKEMGCTPEEVILFCDIAMEGDRGRAEGHGLSLCLGDTLAENKACCRIELFDPAGGPPAGKAGR